MMAVSGRMLLAVSLLWVVMLSGGCGYSTERPFRDDIQTVHVEMFHTKDFRREMEFRLTEAVAKRLEMDTPYRIAGRADADSVISGEIISVQQKTLGNDFRTDRPRELALTVVARWNWKDLRSGEMLREYPRMVYTTTYSPPIGEDFDTGALRGLDGLAERVVASMEKSW
jgi:lipopolysaccharide assembly LptE-like protein